MDKTVVTGMVLSAMPQGEFDKRVVILTRERGKITAFARSARKPHSHLIGATNPFVYAKFEVYEGRNAYTLVGAEVINYFSYFGEHLKEAYLGFAFLEFMNFYTHENNDEYGNLKLLYCALLAISDEKHNLELSRAVFKWKYLVINGIYPPIDNDDSMLKSTRYAFTYLATCDIKDTFKFDLREEEREQFIKFVDDYYKKHHPHENKSLEMYKMI